MVKVRLFCWWCCVCCFVLLTLCIFLLYFYEPTMTTTKLPLVGWLKFFELNWIVHICCLCDCGLVFLPQLFSDQRLSQFSCSNLIYVCCRSVTWVQVTVQGHAHQFNSLRPRISPQLSESWGDLWTSLMSRVWLHFCAVYHTFSQNEIRGCAIDGVYVCCIYLHARWELLQVILVFVVVFMCHLLSAN